MTAGPAFGHGLAEDDEDAGAEGGADADHRQLPQPEGAPEGSALALAALGDQALHGLAPHEPRAEPRGRGGGPTALLRGCALVEHALAPSSLPVGAAGTGGTLEQGPTERGPRHATYRRQPTSDGVAVKCSNLAHTRKIIAFMGAMRCTALYVARGLAACNAATLRIDARSLRSIAQGCLFVATAGCRRRPEGARGSARPAVEGRRLRAIA